MPEPSSLNQGRARLKQNTYESACRPALTGPTPSFSRCAATVDTSSHPELPALFSAVDSLLASGELCAHRYSHRCGCVPARIVGTASCEATPPAVHPIRKMTAIHPRCVMARRYADQRTPSRVGPRSRRRVELAEHLCHALPDVRSPALGIEPRGHRRSVHPAELDLVRRLAAHLEQPFVECRMVTAAQQRQ